MMLKGENMALNTGNETVGVNPTVNDTAMGGNNTNTNTQKTQRGTADAAGMQMSLGFGTGNIMSMSNNMGSEYINKLASEIIEIYKQRPAGDRPKISILDRDVMGKLAYSSIVVSLLTDEHVSYYVILLEATGRASQSAQDIIAETAATIRTTGVQQPIYTTDDAIDGELHSEIQKALRAEYGDKPMVSMDGLVLPGVHSDTSNIAIRLASIAYNACRADKALTDGTTKDLNIAAAKQQSPTTVLKLESNLIKGTIQNEVDSPVRADWVVDLDVIDTNKNIQSINLRDAKLTLTRTSGFVDAIPASVPMPTAPGMPVVETFRLHPHIVITSNSTWAATPGYALLGIISSLVMINPNMWPAALMPKDNAKGIRNIGALNMFTNLENHANKIGSVLNLADKKNTADETYNIIKQMFSLSPIVSFDIESFGPQTHYTSLFATAAQPGNSNAKINACKQIINSANWLTNGGFPTDFNPNEIFASQGVIIPMGKWTDKSGERDIRDVDAAFIATQTQDVNEINKWIFSSLPREQSGMDPYLTKVELISKIMPEAIITGKAIRVPFSGKFIETLINAAVSAGLDATYNPEVTFNETSDLSVMNGYLNNGSVGTSGTFARQQTMNGQQQWNTPYSHVGGYRY